MTAHLGTVEAGSGVANRFIPGGAADWTPAGYTPAPGTLNVRVGRAARRQLTARTPGPVAGWDLWPVTIAGRIHGHIVATRDPASVQLIAPTNLRCTLGLEDGAPITVEDWPWPT